MKLPRGESAIVEDAKVRDYLLSPDHPIRRFNARVFSAVGYRHENWQRLRDDLVALAAVVDAELVQTSQVASAELPLVNSVARPESPNQSSPFGSYLLRAVRRASLLRIPRELHEHSRTRYCRP